MGQAEAMNDRRAATLVVVEEGAPYAVPVGNLGELALLHQRPDEPYEAIV